jgi:hypothetical protein
MLLDSMSAACGVAQILQRTRAEKRYLVTPTRTGKLQDTYSITGLDGSLNILLSVLLGKGTPLLLGMEADSAQPVIIVNKLSGKVLEVEDSLTNRGARIHQVSRNGAPNQRWFVKPARLIRRRIVPEVIRRHAQRYWSTFLRFPQAGYSIIADHSGLCLDILTGTTDNGAAVQQFSSNGESSQLWAFVPNNEGSNFIVNLHSGQVLDVADNSLKNYATVQQHPFNGGDSQRWQLLI